MKVLFVYNQKAGKNFSHSILDEIKNECPPIWETNFVAIKEVDKTHILANELIVAVGGDGTVNYVASLVAKHDKTLGIIPKGSGDGLARFLGIPKITKEAIRILANGTKTKIDTARVNKHFFINVAGAGFEARVAHKFGTTGIRGILGYANTILKLFSHYNEKRLKFSTADEEVNTKFFSLSIANGSQWGNNFEIASKADIQDGMLDIAIMKKPKLTQIPMLIAYLTGKRQQDNQLFTYYKASKISIQKAGKRWHVDGEPLKIRGRKQINLDPLNLSIILP